MSSMTTIAGVELRRFLRDRSNIFFVFIFPLLLVVVLGSQFGGNADAGRVAIAGPAGDLRDQLSASLEEANVAVRFDDADSVREQVARGRIDAGIFLTPSVTSAFDAGEAVSLEVVPGSGQGASLAMERLRAVTTALGSARSQQRALVEAGVPAEDARAVLGAANDAVEPPSLRVRDIGQVAEEFRGLGRFDLAAVGQTLIFVFLISLAGSATLIQSRRLGVVERSLAAPVRSRHVVAGQALGRFAIAGFQGGYIIVMTLALFGVDWGTPWLALLILAVFSAVAAGAAMLLGAAVDNDGTASGAGVGLGLVLGALGGCMVPLELFPDGLRTIAHVTPHAWAYEAFAEVQRHDAALVDVLPQLAVLTAMAAALLVLGGWALRRSLARAL